MNNHFKTFQYYTGIEEMKYFQHMSEIITPS
jgi:hypothetical protein